jgi:RNA recognition motif-containing protein
MKKMYVGNLPFDVTEDQLRQVFAQHGTVESVSVITDRTTGQPRGFGFVEMSEADADKAMRALDGHDLGGRSLKVNEARPREGGGGGGGFRGGNDRGGGRSNRW